jgi:hypothetical protein
MSPLFYSASFFLSLSARACSWVIPVSTNAVFVQVIHPQILTGDKKQTLYNLFAAYIHTVPLEQLMERVE